MFPLALFFFLPGFAGNGDDRPFNRSFPAVEGTVFLRELYFSIFCVSPSPPMPELQVPSFLHRVLFFSSTPLNEDEQMFPSVLTSWLLRLVREYREPRFILPLKRVLRVFGFGLLDVVIGLGRHALTYSGLSSPPLLPYRR